MIRRAIGIGILPPLSATVLRSVESGSPSTHTCDTKAAILPEEVVTLPEVLQAAGFITGGVPNNINITRSFNFQQGFDWFAYQEPTYLFGATASASRLSMYNVVRKLRDRYTGGATCVETSYQPAEKVLSAAERFIEANEGRRWFLFIHLMEPHDPYFEHPLNGKAYGHAEHEHPDPALTDYLKTTYAGEVTHVDARIGEFVDWLKDRKLYDPTLLVVTADHGEEFFEHGGWWHGTTLYDEQIHVPAILKLPGQAHGGVRVPWQVRQIDLPASIAEAMGVELPVTWQGKPLLDTHFQRFAAPRIPVPADIMAPVGTPPQLQDSPLDLPWGLNPASRPALSEEDFEGNRLSAIRAGGWKYVEANEGNRRGLPSVDVFDLAVDPQEKRNLTGIDAERQGQLSRMLMAEIEAAASVRVKGSGNVIDDTTRSRLEALGYMDGEPEPESDKK